MTAVEWQTIERIYLAASDVPEVGRSAFLDEACSGAAAVRTQVERMLAADGASEGFLETPPSQLAANLLATYPPTLAPGERVAHYEIRSLVSVGGMGEVYLAEDIRARRSVALKLIRRHLLANTQAAERFAAEARSAGALHHSNVVALYEFGKSDVGMFIAMEWIDGQTWRALMDAAAIPLDDARAWSRQAASGVAAAHSAGITHRDLKPENIMLTQNGVVKILDFGLARQSGSRNLDIQASGASGTISGTLSGTLSYMSPELFRGEAANASTDIFSLGSVFYELFCGVHPFAGETPLDIYEAIECHVPERPSAVRPGIAPEIDELLLRMLNPNREERPPASEVASVLDRLSEQ